MTTDAARASLVFPLSDALTLPLSLHQSGNITGHSQFGVDAGDFNISFTVKVVSSAMEGDEAAVLLKIRKRLWAYLGYRKKKSLLTLLVIDADKAGFHESGPHEGIAKEAGKLLLEPFMRKYAHAVTAMFTRPASEANWSAHAFDHPVVERQGKADKEGAGVPSQ